MGINYLHDFTEVLDTAVEKFDGIETAFGLESSEDFSKQEVYKNKVLEFRKEIRTKRIIKITDIFDMFDQFVNEESLALYSVEKAFSFVKGYENSKPKIKSIMNKFDKSLRTSVIKEILDQYNIKTVIKRGSDSEYNNIDDISLKDPRKTESKLNRYRTDRSLQEKVTNTKTPSWTIEIEIPKEAINVKSSSLSTMNVRVPLQSNQDNSSHPTPYITLIVKYQFKPLIKFFINNIRKIDKYQKDIELFKKELMKHVVRQVSFSANVYKRLHNSRKGHPYISDQGSWCSGDYSGSLEDAYQKMDITLLATTVYKWMTSYTVGSTNPHNRIEDYYNWLSEDAGTEVRSMPHSERQASDCWAQHETTDTCKARKCAFINSCPKYAQYAEGSTKPGEYVMTPGEYVINGNEGSLASSTGSLTVQGNMTVGIGRSNSTRNREELRETMLVADNMSLTEVRNGLSRILFGIACLENNDKERFLQKIIDERTLKDETDNLNMLQYYEDLLLTILGIEEDFPSLSVSLRPETLLPIINHIDRLFTI